MEDNLLKDSNEFLSNIKNGKAFLVTKNKDNVNVMQIGWGYIGFMWGKPSIIIGVRHSRYTYEQLQNSDEFVISIPKLGEFDDKLKICGTQSGRDINKVEKCGFEMVDGQKVNVPYIKGCQYHYECKVDYKQSLDPELLNRDILDKSYKKNDYHVMIYGEIVSSHQ